MMAQTYREVLKMLNKAVKSKIFLKMLPLFRAIWDVITIPIDLISLFVLEIVIILLNIAKKVCDIYSEAKGYRKAMSARHKQRNKQELKVLKEATENHIFLIILPSIRVIAGIIVNISYVFYKYQNTAEDKEYRREKTVRELVLIFWPSSTVWLVLSVILLHCIGRRQL